MCRFLKLSKSTYYFNLKKKEKIQNNIYDEAVISAFKENKEVYGTRRLKVILANQEIYLSRRKIKKMAFLPLCTIFKSYHINAEKSLSTNFSPHF
ncbi:hypothetical protein [Spiroplasma ixodetis]|uniref:Transposase n=1 Tax=Spiroplasma ixodetis TaxID=2141 RepID=A0ABM8BSZ8_9MOLU|nr:hypothetical protein [Spiroplasma ixodetis]BDT02947.1 hypothetical protein SHM_05930 [Spiroplasma ixodetis]